MDIWRSKYFIPAIEECRHSDKRLCMIGTGNPLTYLNLGVPAEKALALFDPYRLRDSKCSYKVYDICESAVSEMKRLRIDAATFDVTSSPLPDKYDFIFSSDVIEHVENPVAMLRNIRDSLRPSGRAVLTTPNANYWRNFVTLNYQEFPEHNFAFSSKHFENLAVKTSLKIVDLLSFQALNANASGLQLLKHAVHCIFAFFGRGSSLLLVVERS